MAAQLSEELGLRYVELHEGQEISGVYRRRVDLASGTLALIQSGSQFTLTPWIHTLPRNLAIVLTRTATADRVSWSIDRSRSPVMP